MSDTCIKCGEEYWGDEDTCDDCKDFDLENDDDHEDSNGEEKNKLPFFGVPTTKSQNTYYL